MLISYRDPSATITVITRALMTFARFLSCRRPRRAASTIRNMTAQNLEHVFQPPRPMASSKWLSNSAIYISVVLPREGRAVSLLRLPSQTVPVSSGEFFPQMFWLYKQRAAASVLGCSRLMNLCACWTRFTLKQIRAALFPGASLAISILSYRSLSAHSPHSGGRERRMRSGRGNNNRQWVEWGWSSVSVLSGGRRQLWHISSMKVNGTEDLQDNTNSTDRRHGE